MTEKSTPAGLGRPAVDRQERFGGPAASLWMAAAPLLAGSDSPDETERCCGQMADGLEDLLQLGPTDDAGNCSTSPGGRRAQLL